MCASACFQKVRMHRSFSLFLVSYLFAGLWQLGYTWPEVKVLWAFKYKTKRKKKKKKRKWNCIRGGGVSDGASWRQRIPLEALRRQSRSIAARRCRKVKVSAVTIVMKQKCLLHCQDACIKLKFIKLTDNWKSGVNGTIQKGLQSRLMINKKLMTLKINDYWFFK